MILKILNPTAFEDLFRTNRSAMYTQATMQFIQRWGYDLLPEDEPDPDVTYSVQDINDFPAGDERQEEEERRSQFKKTLYSVCNGNRLHCSTFADWFR